MKTSPTQRTCAFLRAAGHTVGITEKWNSFVKRRQDLFNFIDLVAMHPDNNGILAIQTTTGAHHGERRAKILELAAARLWLQTGNRIWVLSWTVKGAKGKRKLWSPRIDPITLADFAEAA